MKIPQISFLCFFIPKFTQSFAKQIQFLFILTKNYNNFFTLFNYYLYKLKFKRTFKNSNKREIFIKLLNSKKIKNLLD